jgi:hypothetical protein
MTDASGIGAAGLSFGVSSPGGVAGSNGLGGGGGTNTFRGLGGGAGGAGLLGAGAEGVGSTATNAQGGGTYMSSLPFAGGATLYGWRLDRRIRRWRGELPGRCGWLHVRRRHQQHCRCCSGC